MESKQSTIFRQVQPSLPYSFQFNRLSSSSPHSDNSNSQQQPLLHNHKNHDQECMEQLKLDIEANWKKNESLEKRSAALGRQVRELRVAIYKQQSRVSPIVETYVAALENQIHELKSAMSRLESSSHQLSPVDTSTGMGSDAALKEVVDRLEHRVVQLELDSLMSVRKQEMEKVVEKNAELGNQLTQLTSTIDQLKSSSSHLLLVEQETDLTTPMEAEHGMQGHETKDLVSCLVVLIFLVSVLIGVTL
ncbi:uncharacterized protein LOC114318958 isoform X2 [Camellia sinensis]|uniref:uncharacterized protein LOC114318958 isoform X2 n=1 Tax=Camellia sinensis TaxID=4442 RepID=UPI001036BF08|nr:uncharacterized protein LOC114318958 isoform X2 [Camellia sinensis]